MRLRPGLRSLAVLPTRDALEPALSDEPPELLTVDAELGSFAGAQSATAARDAQEAVTIVRRHV